MRYLDEITVLIYYSGLCIQEISRGAGVGVVVAVRAVALGRHLAEVPDLARVRQPAPLVVMLLTTATLLPVLPEAFHVARLARPNARLVGQEEVHTRVTVQAAGLGAEGEKDLAGPPVNVSIFQNSSARLS